MAAEVDHQTLRVEVDLVIGADPIRGQVRDADGERAFTGWLELIQTLDRARISRHPAAPEKHWSTGLEDSP